VRILLIEPDAVLMRVLERGLQAHGYEVLGTDSADQAIIVARDPAIRCAIVDASLPPPGGHVVQERLRADRPQLPVLTLTSSQNGALDGGPGDYLHKPFALEELIGRIHAKTRDANEPRVTTLVAGDLRLDLLARCAWRGERLIDLPSREFALLEYFMRHPERVLSRQAILADVWGYHYDPESDSNLVDVYVRYVRNKIGEPGSPAPITTVRGAGYRFDPPGTAISQPLVQSAPCRPT